MAAAAAPMGESFLCFGHGPNPLAGQAKRLCGLSPLQQYHFLFLFQIIQIQF
jgi:hypothetical protein